MISLKKWINCVLIQKNLKILELSFIMKINMIMKISELKQKNISMTMVHESPITQVKLNTLGKINVGKTQIDITNNNFVENQNIIIQIMRELASENNKKLEPDEIDELINIYKIEFNEHCKDSTGKENKSIRKVGIWRILNVEFENILSYKKGKIEFDKIDKEYKIIGINGVNGSGKSSIINIILFAIFGDTERYETKTERELMLFNNNASNKAIYYKTKITIEFDDKLYVIERKVLRQKINETEYSLVKDGKIYNLKIINKATNTIIKECNGLNDVKNNIEKVFGTYDEFKKTILISQESRSDSEFMSISEDERFRLLSEILNIKYLNDFCTKNKLILKKLIQSRDELYRSKSSIANDITKMNIDQYKNKIKTNNDLITKINSEIEDNKIERGCFFLRKINPECEKMKLEDITANNKIIEKYKNEVRDILGLEKKKKKTNYIQKKDIKLNLIKMKLRGTGDLVY